MYELSKKFALLLAGLALAPGAGWTERERAVGYAVAPRPVARPDLMVQIHGRLPAAVVVPNGATVTRSAPATLTVRVTVRNLSTVPVNEPTVTAISITGAGASITGAPTEVPPIAAGSTRVHEFAVPCSPGTNTITAFARADDGSRLGEANEANNAATYRATIEIRR